MQLRLVLKFAKDQAWGTSSIPTDPEPHLTVYHSISFFSLRLRACSCALFLPSPFLPHHIKLYACEPLQLCITQGIQNRWSSPDCSKSDITSCHS
ncbi:hypothetical protein L873DRAFT_786467 [Choiromyces venosus 120613-1]|uniref:Uncharacterized protein n=1 Tax=Choiromyces venosus 120613-1 TaxID=1336337 RepID=A0A3N4K481_9PEZI|nr:hypothetical protein L873DRAFT_786467 [Choiromyces venosus 120613-1]